MDQKRRLIQPWYLYKKTLTFTEEAFETFNWIDGIHLQDVFNYIKTTLDEKPEIREKIKNLNRYTILELIRTEFSTKYTSIIMERALYSYCSLLHNWSRWTRRFKENIAYHRYLEKQLTPEKITTQYNTLKNPNTQVRYIAEEYNMDISTYITTLVKVYNEFIQKQTSVPKNYLYAGPKSFPKLILPGYVRVVWRNP
jgi:hypothetical protein